MGQTGWNSCDRKWQYVHFSELLNSTVLSKTLYIYMD
jgi:hypothetical protein